MSPLRIQQDYGMLVDPQRLRGVTGQPEVQPVEGVDLRVLQRRVRLVVHAECRRPACFLQDRWMQLGVAPFS